MTEPLRELIERVEKATGPDREIDWAISVYDPLEPPIGESPPAYTASLDAITVLIERVLPGAHWSVQRGFTGEAILWPEPDANTTITEYGKTPPLALCLALLRSRLQDDQ